MEPEVRGIVNFLVTAKTVPLLDIPSGKLRHGVYPWSKTKPFCGGILL